MLVPKLYDNLCFQWGPLPDAYVAEKHVHAQKKLFKGTGQD